MPKKSITLDLEDVDHMIQLVALLDVERYESAIVQGLILRCKAAAKEGAEIFIQPSGTS